MNLFDRHRSVIEAVTDAIEARIETVGDVEGYQDSLLSGSVYPAIKANEPRLAHVVANNTLAQLVTRGVTVAAGIGTNAILSRYLGPTGFGVYNLVFAYLAVATGIFADWGLGAIVVRDASQEPDQVESILASASVLQLVASVLAYISLLAIGHFLAHGSLDVAMSIAGLPLLLVPLTILAGILQVRLRLVRAAGVGVIGAVLTLSAVVLAVRNHAAVIGIVAAITVATILRYGLILVAIRKQLAWRKLRPQRTRFKPLMKASWPLALSTTFSTITQQAPILLLAQLSTSSQIGYFSAASKIASQMTIPPLVLMTSLYPLLSGFAATNRNALAALMNKSLKYIILLAAPLALVGMVMAPWIVRILYGHKFGEASSVFALLTVQAAVLYPTIIASQALIALGRQRLNLWLNICESVLVVAGCVVAIPRFGANGAAVILLSGASVMCCAVLWAADRHVDINLRRLNSISIPIVAMTLCVMFLHPFLPEIVVLALSCISYLILLRVTRLIDHADVAMVTSLFRKKPFTSV